MNAENVLLKNLATRRVSGAPNLSTELGVAPKQNIVRENVLSALGTKLL
jgi:hypothetical protein